MPYQSWTDGRALALTKRKVGAAKRAITEHIGGVSALWMDEDGFLEREAEEIVAEFQRRLDRLIEDAKDAVRERREREQDAP